ncbi:MAG: hypothetical protein JWP44_983 [Mucilaginibacter sp.]|nr:hypothetical protein [Mucilaginibacter sp.]
MTFGNVCFTFGKSNITIMKSRFLFPYWCRYLGYVCIVGHVPVMLLGKMIGFDHQGSPDQPGIFSSHHLFFIATTLLVAIGLFLIAFSKEKIEDEQISQLRLDSLQWAVYFNYFLLITSLILTNDIEHVLFLNLWVPLIFFIVRFRWVIFRLNRSLSREG